MDMGVSVGRITELPTDLDVLIELSHKEAFGAVGVLRDRWLDGSNRFGGPGEALLEARANEGQLLGIFLGICGLNIDPYGAREYEAGEADVIEQAPRHVTRNRGYDAEDTRRPARGLRSCPWRLRSFGTRRT